MKFIVVGGRKGSVMNEILWGACGLMECTYMYRTHYSGREGDIPLPTQRIRPNPGGGLLCSFWTEGRLWAFRISRVGKVTV